MSAEVASPPAPTSSPPGEGPAGLYPKLLEVMRTLGRVPERGWNEAQSYAYVREEDLVDAVRARLIDVGVLVIPSMESIEDRATSRVDRETGAVTPGWPITRVVMRYRFIDAATGEAEEIRMPGDGSDGGDKGVYKALTGAFKYALREPFLMPTGDDAEQDGAPPGAGVGAHPTGGGSPSAAARPGARGGRTATEAQQRMMFARARSHGLSDEDRDRILMNTAGAGSLELVPMDAVDNVLTAFAAGVVATGQSDVTPPDAAAEFRGGPYGPPPPDDDVPF